VEHLKIYDESIGEVNEANYCIVVVKMYTIILVIT